MEKYLIQDEINRRSIWHPRARAAARLAHASAVRRSLTTGTYSFGSFRGARDEARRAVQMATLIRRTYWDAYRTLPR